VRQCSGASPKVAGTVESALGTAAALARRGAGAGRRGLGTVVGSQKLQDPHAFPLRHVRIEGELRNLAEADLQPAVGEVLAKTFSWLIWITCARRCR